MRATAQGELRAHGILRIDKPQGASSHDLVNRVRRALGTRRVGHAGTLDPMATGLLLVAVGEALKLLRYLALDDKRYEARVRLGTETDTLDAYGEVTRRAAIAPELSLERVREVAHHFVGGLRQRPPKVSALKQDGEPLYARARRGEAVEPAEREVVVHSLQIDALEGEEIVLRVHCGKGFYVRALARDLGYALGTCAHLSSLRRTHSGVFGIDDAVPWQLVLNAAGDPVAAASLREHLLPIAAALPDAPSLTLDESGAEHARHGRRIAPAHVARGGELVAGLEPILLLSPDGEPLALARVEADADVAERLSLRVVRGLLL